MSLMRQIWMAVLAITMVAFAGSLFISIYSARGYLEQQLQRKNSDNANALALSMSQQDKDPVTIELQVAALFDSGHYQSVIAADPFGKTIVQRIQETRENGAPEWFVALFPIRSTPGSAQVSDGWKQYATVHVVSHTRFAYQSLWQGAQKLIVWFVIGGLVAGGFGMVLLRLITGPLNAVVGQAAAIGERRFVTIDEPKTPELRTMVQAMNAMVERVKQMFGEEAARLDALRQKINHDEVTTLSNRDFFMSHLKSLFSQEDAPPFGSVALVRIDLPHVNKALGFVRTDALLRDLGRILDNAFADRDGQMAGRIKGGDFAIVIPESDSADKVAAALHEALVTGLLQKYPEVQDLFHLGVIHYRRGQSPSEVLIRGDQALAVAEGKGPNSWHAVEDNESAVAVPGEGWRSVLSGAVDSGRIKLAFYPVIASAGGALHQESVIRLQASSDGQWLSAGDFMPMAARLNLTAPLDLGVVHMVLAHLALSDGDVAINLSAETIANWGFRNDLVGLLKTKPALCKRMWFEVPEYGVFKNLEAFRDLCRTLKDLGCRVGIEHFGRQLAESEKLADLGLDYVKVHASLVRGIDENRGNQEFLKGLCNIAHSIGIRVVAIGVQTTAELDVLQQLGFDGATGPVIKE